MSTQNPAPYPSGKRTLNAKEQLLRAQALACLSGKEQTKCQGQVYVSLFFDGTGNNINSDYFQATPDQQKPSNIARLYLTARDKSSDGYFRFYMPGVGTPFPEVGDNGGWFSLGQKAGGAAGWYGEERILWGLAQLLNAPHIYVTGSPLIPPAQTRTIISNAGGLNGMLMRKTILRTWQEKLQAALKGRKPQLTQINLSVFGFSRGATEARAFVNWLYQVCKQENGGWHFAGIPLRTQFLGIFDTVASVGIAQLFPDNLPATGHMAWADGNLAIHPAVEQCVHYMAAHEVRATFPLDTVRRGNGYPGNAVEVMYPGSHSDVGGGYASGALGILPAQDSQMCVIPCSRMYEAARQAGVPLLAMGQLDKKVQDLLTPTQQVINDFNAYLRDAKVVPASAEKMHQQHMALYLSQRFKYRREFTQRAPYRTASSKHREYLQQTQQGIIKGLAKLNAGNPMAPDFDPVRAAAEAKARDQKHDKELKGRGISIAIASPETNPINVAASMDLRRLTPAIEHFLDSYIHDSVAGFIEDAFYEGTANGCGLFKFRALYKGDE